ncbi:cell division protein CrgA [Neoactinobaculum massilliense]|uniref:cell division protein CrgA n=1 Tax=Neoactinobaculum massilliense TaxID=2364794 RepID=UPI000F5445A1|nr:cell division protein CrgA [Neoactinobaculum massilliense]
MADTSTNAPENQEPDEILAEDHPELTERRKKSARKRKPKASASATRRPGTKADQAAQKELKVHAGKPKKPAGQQRSPRWWAPTMVTLMILGLLIVVVYYLFGGGYPIPAIGNWNLGIGFGIMIIGFLMTMGWK